MQCRRGMEGELSIVQTIHMDGSGCEVPVASTERRILAHLNLAGSILLARPNVIDPKNLGKAVFLTHGYFMTTSARPPVVRGMVHYPAGWVGRPRECGAAFFFEPREPAAVTLLSNTRSTLYYNNTMYIMREVDRKVALGSPWSRLATAGAGLAGLRTMGLPQATEARERAFPARVGGRSLQGLALTRSWAGGMTSRIVEAVYIASTRTEEDGLSPPQIEIKIK